MILLLSGEGPSDVGQCSIPSTFCDGSSTGYFEQNARALAVKAKELAVELKDEVTSILFRDADGTASTVRDRKIDVNRIDMPSLEDFKRRLFAVLGMQYGH